MKRLNDDFHVVVQPLFVVLRLIRITNPNLKPILAFPKTTHPNLPKGKELVTQNTVISPHLASPEGEGQILLLLISH